MYDTEPTLSTSLSVHLNFSPIVNDMEMMIIRFEVADTEMAFSQFKLILSRILITNFKVLLGKQVPLHRKWYSHYYVHGWTPAMPWLNNTFVA